MAFFSSRHKRKLITTLSFLMATSVSSLYGAESSFPSLETLKETTIDNENVLLGGGLGAVAGLGIGAAGISTLGVATALHNKDKKKREPKEKTPKKKEKKEKPIQVKAKKKARKNKAETPEEREARLQFQSRGNAEAYDAFVRKNWEKAKEHEASRSATPEAEARTEIGNLSAALHNKDKKKREPKEKTPKKKEKKEKPIQVKAKKKARKNKAETPEEREARIQFQSRGNAEAYDAVLREAPENWEKAKKYEASRSATPEAEARTEIGNLSAELNEAVRRKGVKKLPPLPSQDETTGKISADTQSTTRTSPIPEKELNSLAEALREISSEGENLSASSVDESHSLPRQDEAAPVDPSPHEPEVRKEAAPPAFIPVPPPLPSVTGRDQMTASSEPEKGSLQEALRLGLKQRRAQLKGESRDPSAAAETSTPPLLSREGRDTLSAATEVALPLPSSHGIPVPPPLPSVTGRDQMTASSEPEKGSLQEALRLGLKQRRAQLKGESRDPSAAAETSTPPLPSREGRGPLSEAAEVALPLPSSHGIPVPPPPPGIKQIAPSSEIGASALQQTRDNLKKPDINKNSKPLATTGQRDFTDSIFENIKKKAPSKGNSPGIRGSHVGRV